MQAERVFRVGISGSYGGWNLGDEAILHGILKELRRSVPVEVTVFTRDPADTIRRHGVEHAVDVRHLFREEALEELRPLDMFILGGGGILYDAEIDAFLREVSLAHELSIPVVIYAIGVGPLSAAWSRARVCECLHLAAAITVRDRASRQLLEACGLGSEVRVTADPGLLVEAEPLPVEWLEREGLSRDRRLVAMSIREPGPAAPSLAELDYRTMFADAADFMVERLGAHVLLIPMERSRRDLQEAHGVLARMKLVRHASVLRHEYSVGQLLSLIGHSDFAVGMRLHFLMFAALNRVPLAPLTYAPKISGFMESLGLGAHPLELFGTGSLIATIDRAWDGRESIRARLDAAVPRLQELARETNAIAVRVLLERQRSEAAHANHPH